MQISVVVPSYKEGHRIRKTVDAITSFCSRHFDEWEILLVDDGSGDATESAVVGIERVVYLCNDGNRGKGFSVRRGMLEARFDPILFTDADLSTPIEDALALLGALREGADVAIGSRTPSDEGVRRTPHRMLMAMVFRLLVKTIVLRGFRDTQCGFKMFRREAARKIFALQRLDRWGFDVEVLYLARTQRLRVAQVPVSYVESSESRLSLMTPITMIVDLLRIRWNALAGKYRPGQRP